MRTVRKNGGAGIPSTRDLIGTVPKRDAARTTPQFDLVGIVYKKLSKEKALIQNVIQYESHQKVIQCEPSQPVIE